MITKKATTLCELVGGPGDGKRLPIADKALFFVVPSATRDGRPDEHVYQRGGTKYWEKFYYLGLRSDMES